MEAWVYRCWELAILMLHTFHFNVCLLYFSMTVHWWTRKDLFSCCPAARRTWEAAGTEELGSALLLSLFVICVIAQHMHILPGDTQGTRAAHLVLWWNRNHDGKPLSASVSCASFQKQQGSRKVQCSLPGGKESPPGLFQVAKQTCTAEAEKQALLTCCHQLINVEPSASLAISIDFASEK